MFRKKKSADKCYQQIFNIFYLYSNFLFMCSFSCRVGDFKCTDFTKLLFHIGDDTHSDGLVSLYGSGYKFTVHFITGFPFHHYEVRYVIKSLEAIIQLNTGFITKFLIGRRSNIDIAYK